MSILYVGIDLAKNVFRGAWGELLVHRARQGFVVARYSRRTEQAYVYWCKAFIRFHGLRQPADMGRTEVEAFLSWLACERKVAASTHT